MAFDDNDKLKSDFERWAEETSYAEEKEMKLRMKQEAKEKKRLEKEQKRNQKRAAKQGNAEEAENTKAENAESAAAEQTESVNTEAAATESAQTETIEGAQAETTENTQSESTDTAAEEATDSDNTQAETTTDTAATESSDEKSEESSSENTEVAEGSEEETPEKEKKKKIKKKKDNGPKRPEDINIVKELLSLIIYIGIIIAICFLIITFVGMRTTVNGKSMENSLYNGDNIWIDKMSYRFSGPKRYDIIVFPYQGEDVYFIKRVIGLPGETVQIVEGGVILINGEPLAESYGKEPILNPGIASAPITLGQDEYFVLGDNRNDSRDSRFPEVGNISKDDIIGKAAFRLSPLSNFGAIDK